MEILGVGPVEFIFIVIILLLVLGPSELGTLGRKIGEFIRKMRTSETWILLANLARTIRNLPTALADEVGVEEMFEDVVPGRNRRTIAPPRPAGPRRPDTPTVQAEAYPAWTTPSDPTEAPPDAPDSQAPEEEHSVHTPDDQLDG